MRQSDAFELTVRINIRRASPSYGSDQLNLEEVLTVPGANFLLLAGLLGRFHELAETMRCEQAKDPQ